MGCAWDSNAATRPTSATGAWKTKIAGQSNACVRIPPSAGPTAAPNVPAAIQIASPRERDPLERAQQLECAGEEHRGAGALHAAKRDQDPDAPDSAQPTEPTANSAIPVLVSTATPILPMPASSANAATATTRL